LSLGSANAIGTTGTISFGGGTLQFTAANKQDYSGRFSTAVNQTYKIDTNGQNVTFGSALTSQGGTLTKLGAGTLKLSADNTFNGATMVNAGTLDLANLNALEKSTLTLNGGSLVFDSAAGGTAFILGGLAGNGSLALVTNASKAVNLTVGGNGTSSIYSGVLSGAGSLTKVGTGVLTLTSSNSYSGGTTISAGTLAINGDTALGAVSSGLTIDGGTLQTTNGITTNRLITLTSNGGTIDADGNTSNFSGVISGSGALTKVNSGTVVLTAINTYTGATTINGGTLQVGNGTIANSAISGSASITIGAGATLALDLLSSESFTNAVTDNGLVSLIGTTAYTVSGAISGTGGLIQTGSGIVTITGNNSFTGAITLNGGELSLGSQGAIGSPDHNTNPGIISFGGGALQFTAANTLDYSGRFSAASGQAYKIDVNQQNGQSVNVTFGTALTSSGGSLTKLGAGTLTLSAANTFTGATTVSAGTLDLNNPLALQNSTVTLSGGAVTFDSNAGGTAFTFGGLAGSGNLALVNNAASPAAIALTVGSNGNSTSNTYSGVLSESGASSGQASLTMDGFGTLTLAGANTYTGGTTINKGTLQVGNGTAAKASVGTGLVTVGASGALALDLLSGESFGNAVDSTGQVKTIGSTNYTVSGVISGSGTFTDSDTGTVTITGANTYGGITIVSAGTLQLGDGTAALASLGTGTVTVNSGATLVLNLLSGESFANANTVNDNGHIIANGAGNYLVSSAITGAGDFTMAGSGTVTLTGNITYSNGTTVKSGTLQVGNGTAGGSLGNGGVTVNSGAILALELANGNSFSNAVTNNGQIVLVLPSVTTNFNVTGPIGGSGTLIDNNPGSVTVTGTNSYSGGTTISAGNLQVGDGSIAGASLGTGTVTVGAGTSLVLNLASGGSFTNAVANNGQVQTIGSTTYTVSGIISGTGDFSDNDTGTVTVTGHNTYSGGTTVNKGNLQVGNGTVTGASIGTNSVAVASGATLTLDLADGETFSNTVSGAGGLTVIGSGVVTVSGTNTYSGVTNLNGGELSLGSTGAIGSPDPSVDAGLISFAGGGLQFSSTNTQDYSGRFSNASGQAYKIDVKQQSGENVNVTFAASLTSSGGTLTKLGAGTLTLSVANTFNGATSVNAGTLDLADQNALQNSTVTLNGGVVTFDATVASDAFTFGGLAGSGNLALVNNAVSPAPIALTVGGNNSTNTYSGVLSGTGDLTMTGSGTLTLSGTNTYTGGTNLNGGVLSLGSEGAVGSTGAISFGGGTLQFTSASANTDFSARFSNADNQAYKIDTNGQNVTFASSLNSNGGTLTKTGAGNLTLTGSNGYTGGTSVNAGTLLANNTASSATGSGSVNVNNGGTLGGSGTISGATTLNSGGRILPSAGTIGTAGTTLNASSLLWNGGSTLSFQIGTTADQLALTGALTKGSGSTFTIEILDAGITTTATTFTLMTFSSTDFALSDFTLQLPANVTGTLAFNANDTALLLEDLQDPAAPQPSVMMAAAFVSGSDPSGSTGSTPSTDFVSGTNLTATPEPGGAALMLLGAGTLLGWHRRRRK
jgi:autotransporter-associated beta strand protein